MCIRDRVYTAEADIPQYERAVKQTRLSLDILAQGLGDALRLAVADLHPLGIAAAAAQLFLSLIHI